MGLRQRWALLVDFVQEENFLREKPEEGRQLLQLSHQRLPQLHGANGYPRPVTETNSPP